MKYRERGRFKTNNANFKTQGAQTIEKLDAAFQEVADGRPSLGPDFWVQVRDQNKYQYSRNLSMFGQDYVPSNNQKTRLTKRKERLSAGSNHKLADLAESKLAHRIFGVAAYIVDIENSTFDDPEREGNIASSTSQMREGMKGLIEELIASR